MLGHPLVTAAYQKQLGKVPNCNQSRDIQQNDDLDWGGSRDLSLVSNDEQHWAYTLNLEER